MDYNCYYLAIFIQWCKSLRSRKILMQAMNNIINSENNSLKSNSRYISHNKYLTPYHLRFQDFHMVVLWQMINLELCAKCNFNTNSYFKDFRIHSYVLFVKMKLRSKTITYVVKLWTQLITSFTTSLFKVL